MESWRNNWVPCRAIAYNSAQTFEAIRTHKDGATTRLQHQVVIITGGGSGIGEAIAVRSARQGAKIIVVDGGQLLL